jgi:hypothetical protein
MASIVESTRAKIKRYLKEIYGKNYRNVVQEVDKTMVIQHGSASVNVVVRPLSKDDCLVTTQAYVVQGAKIGPKILGMLMRHNATNPIGAFGLLFDDTIVFRHSVSGANLDVNELRLSIRTVAFFADEYDEEIVRITGGKRAVDAHSLIDGDVLSVKAPPAKKVPDTGKSSSTSGKKKSGSRRKAPMGVKK